MAAEGSSVDSLCGHNNTRESDLSMPNLKSNIQGTVVTKKLCESAQQWRSQLKLMKYM